MIRHTISLAITLGISQMAAEAQISIAYNGSGGESNVVDRAGVAINGDTVSIGTFLNGFDPSISGNGSNLGAIQANWLNFDSTTTRTIIGVDGRFAAQSPSVNNSLFDGKKIYLWITEPGGSGISEYGLYSSSGSDWIFPAHDSIPPFPIINSNEVDQFLFGDGITSGGGGSLRTDVVAAPEPAAIALLGAGLVLTSVIRRRNR